MRTDYEDPAEENLREVFLKVVFDVLLIRCSEFPLKFNFLKLGSIPADRRGSCLFNKLCRLRKVCVIVSGGEEPAFGELEAEHGIEAD